jgi:hypothetical protein
MDSRFLSMVVVILLLATPARGADREVCTGGCEFPTVAAAAAAVGSGDTIVVAAGTWTECGLSLQDGVHIRGAGRGSAADGGTVLDTVGCPASTALTVGTSSTVQSLRLLPAADGVGIQIGQGSSVLDVEVRGGSTGAVSPGVGGSVEMESCLIVGDASMGTAIDTGGTDWSVRQVTLFRADAPGGVGIDATASALEVHESVLVGWTQGIVGQAGQCGIELSVLWDMTTDLMGCAEPAALPAWRQDPQFVSTVGLAGDFHLDSTAGTWDGSSFVPGVVDSPFVDAGLPDAARAAAEAGSPCELPNLGAYGGTSEASRAWQVACPATHVSSATGYPTLQEAIAAGGSDGDVIELRDGLHLAATPAVVDWNPVIQPASGAAVVLLNHTDGAVFELDNGGVSGFTLSGFQLGPHVDGGGDAITCNNVACNAALEGMTVLGGRAIATSNQGDRTLAVTASALGSSAAPLQSDALRLDDLGSNLDQWVLIEDSEIWAIDACLQLDRTGSGGGVNVSVAGSTLRCGGRALHLATGMNTATSPREFEIHGSVLVGGDSVVHVDMETTVGASWSLSNSLLVESGSSPDNAVEMWAGADPYISVTNCTLVDGTQVLALYSGAPAAEVANNVFVHGALHGAFANDPGSDPAAYQYNAFWGNGTAPANFTLPGTNYELCDPGFPYAPTDPFDPTFDPADYTPQGGSCLLDAGDPGAVWEDAPGDRNDLGASGGPDGGDFLVLLGTTPVDADGDGFTDDVDCDDTDPAVHPGALEVCDGVDNDCDGALPPDELDGDGDGQAACGGDCDDTDPDSWDGAPELCDGVDNDCDGLTTDEATDDDGDGYSVCTGDCDDDEPAAYPDNPEICDGVDNDCSGATAADEVDADADGSMLCAGDCDDDDDEIHPGAAEGCDGLDTDCSGAPDPAEVDDDGDGWVECEGDCDDLRASVNPDVVADLCDGSDTDCDGVLPEQEQDADGDGWLECEGFIDAEPADGIEGGGDCDPVEPTVNPGATETCDGWDTDCDGFLIDGEGDADSDGYLLCDSPPDCDDGDLATWPGAPELCDAVDQDCDGDVLEQFDDENLNGIPDCIEGTEPSLPPAPGCEMGCAAADGASRSAAGLLLLPVLLASRRRRGGPPGTAVGGRRGRGARGEQRAGGRPGDGDDAVTGDRCGPVSRREHAGLAGVGIAVAVLLGVSGCLGPPAVDPDEVSCAEDMAGIPGQELVVGARPEVGRPWVEAPRTVHLGAYCIDRYEFPNLAGELPRSEASWHEATASCRAAGKRLCTSAEWELACRGPSGRLYSYGTDRDPSACNTPFEGGGPGGLPPPKAPSGSLLRCVTPEGVYDLNGNLSEWVVDVWAGPPEPWQPAAEVDGRWHTLRGGTMWRQTHYGQDCASRHGHRGDSQIDDDGFRCCSAPVSEH